MSSEPTNTSACNSPARSIRIASAVDMQRDATPAKSPGTDCKVRQDEEPEPHRSPHRSPPRYPRNPLIFLYFSEFLGYFQDFLSNIRVFGPGEVGIV